MRLKRVTRSKLFGGTQTRTKAMRQQRRTQSRCSRTSVRPIRYSPIKRSVRCTTTGLTPRTWTSPTWATPRTSSACSLEAVVLEDQESSFSRAEEAAVAEDSHSAISGEGEARELSFASCNLGRVDFKLSDKLMKCEIFYVFLFTLKLS